MSINSNMFHHLAIDIYVKHVPVLLHMAFAVSWVLGAWQIVFIKGLAFYGSLLWSLFFLMDRC
jgi:hypothetical protein